MAARKALVRPLASVTAHGSMAASLLKRSRLGGTLRGLWQQSAINGDRSPLVELPLPLCSFLFDKLVLEVGYAR